MFNRNTKEIFKQFVSIDLDEKVYNSSETVLYDGISIIGSFSGIVSGQIIMNISSELAKVIYHRYTKGILAIDIDKEVKDTIFQLAKLIIGNSCASFYENGLSTEIVSSSIVEGKDINYIWINKNITIINYETSMPDMKMMLILDISGKGKIDNFNN
ncbi:MAG: hypothetical protein WDA24_06475 [Tissierellales bacterium]